MQLAMTVRKRSGAFTLSVDLDIRGDRIGIFGASGSGKSTLVGMLAGLMKPDEGEIVLNGDCLFSSSRGVNRRPEQRRIAVVFQHPHLFPHLDVERNLLYGYRRCPPDLRRISLEPVVEALELGPMLSRSVSHLSGGEQQRVALGRALLSNPRLMLLDEPLSALDDSLKYRIIPFLRKTFDAFDVPFIFISHSLLEMRLMSEHVVVLEGGRVVEETGAEALAVRRMGAGGAAYVNLLRLSSPRMRNGLSVYRWGGAELAIAGVGGAGTRVFELSSRDIILFRNHPGAISARNLLACRVVRGHAFDGRTGIELSCGEERIIAEVMRETAEELDIRPGQPIFAAIKASAFREIL